jgi:hypothetical protein
MRYRKPLRLWLFEFVSDTYSLMKTALKLSLHFADGRADPKLISLSHTASPQASRSTRRCR